MIAAGGLADGSALVAALALGAHGVWMGTRFIATEEARGHINYKNRITEIDEDGTTISRANSGKTARIIKNSFTEYWEINEEKIKPFPTLLKEVGLAAAVAGRMHGDVDNGVLAAGQSSGLINKVKPAGEVVSDIVAQAKEVLTNLNKQ